MTGPVRRPRSYSNLTKHDVAFRRADTGRPRGVLPDKVKDDYMRTSGSKAAERSSSVSSAPRLPRGRHGLTRALVENDQRDRALAAIVDEVAQRGYAHTTITHVVARAHLSRQTFYSLFQSKEDCYAEAYRRIGNAVIDDARGALATRGGTRMERLERALDGYLAMLAAHPAVTRCLARASSQARRRRTRAPGPGRADPGGDARPRRPVRGDRLWRPRQPARHRLRPVRQGRGAAPRCSTRS
jgi:AcrR family transcriptional regulator